MGSFANEEGTGPHAENTQRVSARKQNEGAARPMVLEGQPQLALASLHGAFEKYGPRWTLSIFLCPALIVYLQLVDGDSSNKKRRVSSSSGSYSITGSLL